MDDKANVLSSHFQGVRSQIAEAQKIAGGNGSEQDIAEAKVELEVSDDYKSAGALLNTVDPLIGS